MEEKKVTWLELFYDLLFVAAVTVATHVLLHVEDGHIHAEYLVKFVLIFYSDLVGLGRANHLC